MDLTVLAYIVYLTIGIGLTVWVARTLSRTGRVFIADALQGREELADAVNHLLVVGFYLVNIGFVALWLRMGGSVGSARELFEQISVKLGVVLLVLGVMHLGNVWVLSRIRRRSSVRGLTTPPVPPTGWTLPAGA
ncbi:hypothetical protein ACN20G_08680 [Streptomyces sp. BI20]|uniref:hypothetical protein n=1 Tax=Streptomyces sp. BI20 TaxID=3403460 RepID=UPI003C70F7A9